MSLAAFHDVFLSLQYMRFIVLPAFSSHTDNRLISILRFECVRRFGGLLSPPAEFNQAMR